MKKKLGLIAGAALLALSVTSAQAQVVVTTSPGTSFNTAALSGFTTNGAQQNGMEVTVFFSDGSSETIVWAATGATTGGVTGTGWSMTLGGDSFTTPFVMTAGDVQIAGFSMNGRPGVGTIFDVISDPELSPGSARGRPFELFGSIPDGIQTINVEYTDRLSVGGTFYGDLYTVMNVDFDGRFLSNATLRFISDTDNSRFDSIIVPVDPPNGVPEPGTLLLIGSGLLGLAMRRRRLAA
jgi:hypothetical protein